MRLFQSFLFVAMLALGVAGLPVSLAEDDTRAPSAAQPAPPAAESPKPEPDTSAQRSGRLWVCCDDGKERWTATPEVCKQRKGQLLPSRYCERQTVICCKVDRGGIWTNDAASCAKAGGEPSDASACRVCCKQGRAEWWMADDAACHSDGGVVADASYCR